MTTAILDAPTPLTRTGPEGAGYRGRVLGCWLGKAVGGTLGGPDEGFRGTLDLAYYDPVPADMLPNDDLDLQVVWACVLAAMERPRVDRHVLAQAWLAHVGYHFDEYGHAMRNLRNGIPPPWSGACDNHYPDGMGAAIRSELWACLAPGDPALAARYAWEDACVDHAGDGLSAEVFLAALESAAFAEADLGRLIDAGLAAIPADGRLHRAISEVRAWYASRRDWRVVREMIVDAYANDQFTNVLVNVPFIVLALLAGDGDFSRSVCIAANCGMDTDCTAATVGAILGIRDPASIGARWLAPIGRKLVLSREITGLAPPASLDGFTDLVVDLRSRLGAFAPPPATPAPGPGRTAIHVDSAISRCRCWLAPEAAPTAAWRPLALPGHSGALSTAGVPEGWTLLLRLRFRVPSAGVYRVMFSTPGKCLAWLDGAAERAWDRDGGPMGGSFTNVAVQNRCDAHLEAGAHELLVALVPSRGQRSIPYVVGVGTMPGGRWVHDALLAPA